MPTSNSSENYSNTFHHYIIGHLLNTNNFWLIVSIYFPYSKIAISHSMYPTWTCSMAVSCFTPSPFHGLIAAALPFVTILNESGKNVIVGGDIFTRRLDNL